MEGGDREKKHTCKVCKRRFPCGRSLGGHMRSHLSTNSTSEADEKVSKGNKSFLGSSGGPGYGLRENPKKTWRLYPAPGDVSCNDEKLCRVCGKGFHSWKALFGHMRSHSGRSSSSHTLKKGEEEPEEVDEEDGYWNGEASPKMPDVDGQCHVEEVTAVVVPRKKRARRTAVNEIECELEEMAVCLMMLSRGVGLWSVVHPISESSDKNSVVFEENGVAEGGDGDLISDRDESMKTKKLEKVEKRSEQGVTEDGYLSNGSKKVESDVLDDEFGFISRDDEFKKPKVYAIDDAGAEDIDTELRKDSPGKVKLKCPIAELGKGANLVPSKRNRNDAYEAKLSRDCSRNVRYGACNIDLGKDSDKKSRYQCTTCNKIFHSYQALGGHRSSHKRINGCFLIKMDGSENSIETEISVNAAVVDEMSDRAAGVDACDELRKKGKVHQCPICLKMFPSGQALGGHKRSHLAANSHIVGYSTSNQAIVIQKQLPNLLDLNLPAPADEFFNSTDGNVDSN